MNRNLFNIRTGRLMRRTALWAAGLAAATATAGNPSVGPQVRIDKAGTTFAANETSAASTDVFPLEVVGTWNDWRDSTFNEIIRMGVAVSLDGGQTWTDFLVRPPAANQSTVEGDPMTAYDNRTGNLWVGAISFAGNGGVFVAKKRLGQTSFEPSVMARRTGGADKCWMAAGIRPGEPNSTRLYIAYNEGIIWSDDEGQTWTAPRSLGSGIGFLPRVGPQGEVYVCYWDFGSGVMLKRSFNGGSSFDTIRIATRMDVWGTQDGSRFPGQFRVPPLNYLAVHPTRGTLYCVYFDTTDIQNNNRNVDLYFTRSNDRGATWTTPRVINGEANPAGDQFFPWIEVDSSGRLHLVFFDSRGINQNDNAVNGMFNNYYAFSDDDGNTWTEFRLTPAAWNSNNDGLNRSNQFIGDYAGLAVGGTRAYPCYLSTQNGDSDIFVNVVLSQLSGDLNGDGCVNQADLATLLSCFGVGACGDVDGDGDTDQADLAALLANYGAGC
jgi:hypothetical protein